MTMATEKILKKHQNDDIPVVNKFADDVPVTALEVAGAMRVSRWTVSRWRKLGYQFEFGRRTTLGHLKAWLRDQAKTPNLSSEDNARLEAALGRLR
jgi:hypothetical protein